ncbi:hypothetical protein AGR8A_pTi10137 [Agrobacterium fabrum str. J-07]|nr:hypothetical protein AGR8A_pTi10137 [Agrobacterium fabrum str. J-07]
MPDLGWAASLALVGRCADAIASELRSVDQEDQDAPDPRATPGIAGAARSGRVAARLR